MTTDRFFSSVMSHPKTVEIILASSAEDRETESWEAYCCSRFIPLSDFAAPNHCVTVLIFIFASRSLTIPFSIDAAFPIRSV